MMFPPKPTVRFDPPAGDSSPVTASLQSDGMIRVEVDPDSMRLTATYFEPKEFRAWCLEALGLCDASDVIHEEEETLS